MKPASQKKNLSILAICAAVILICGLVMANTKTVGGTVTVQDVVISPYGADLSITMYIPDGALQTDENGNFVATEGHEYYDNWRKQENKE